MLPRPCVSGKGEVAYWTMLREREAEVGAVLLTELPLMLLRRAKGRATEGGGAEASTELGRALPVCAVPPEEPGQGFMALERPKESIGEVGRPVVAWPGREVPPADDAAPAAVGAAATAFAEVEGKRCELMEIPLGEQ